MNRKPFVMENLDLFLLNQCIVKEEARMKDFTKDKKALEGMMSKFLIKRVGQSIDIAGPAVFLASDASSYMTGSEIVIDGGWICVL